MSHMISTGLPNAIYFTDSFQAVAQAERVPRFFVQTNSQIKAIVENASDVCKLGGAFINSALPLHESI
jgi:hypothetical protein